MTTQTPIGSSKKACTRCFNHKRKCDRKLPSCGLCGRLRQSCIYDARALSSPSSSTASPASHTTLYAQPFTLDAIRDSIVRKLEPIDPKEIPLIYSKAANSWFPILSIPALKNRLPTSWDEIPLDLALLCASVVLFSTSPPSAPDDPSNPSEFKSLYLCSKSWISLVEGFGINNLSIVQSRIFVTLFEIGHGFYPAAYMSIGAAVRSADALRIHPGLDSSILSPKDEAAETDEIAAWSAILVLDRYIASESGSEPPVTRLHAHRLHERLKPFLCTSVLSGPNETTERTPICHLSHLLEASSLLDKVHTVLHEPTKEPDFNMDEVVLAVKTLQSLVTIISDQIAEGKEVYSGGLALCRFSLLLTFEQGSKITPIDSTTTGCYLMGLRSINSMLEDTTNLIEPFTQGRQTLELDVLPPFFAILVYKTAALITERLRLDNGSSEGLIKLVISRKFLKMMGIRWLACERYIKLLDDDTTPRIRRMIEQM